MSTLIHAEAKLEAGEVASGHAPDFPFGKFAWVRFNDGTIVDMGAKFDRARDNQILLGNPPKLKGWDMVYSYDPTFTKQYVKDKIHFARQGLIDTLVHMSLDELILSGFEDYLQSRYG